MKRALLEEGRFALERICGETAVSEGHQTLLQALGELWPRWRFAHVLTRGGWHRPGRILDTQGQSVAESAEQWMERAWEACGGDVALLCDEYLEQGLQRSRYAGQTHFFVASYGQGGEQFIQLEIETLSEMLEGALLDAENMPDDLADFLEPAQHKQPPVALGQTHYRFRRVTDIAEFLARMRGQFPESPPACRFVEEWGRSSSAAKSLCAHWVFALSEHLDRFRQPVLSAHPLSLCVAGKAKFSLPDDPMQRADALQAFDRGCGYSAAWYFHMLAGAGVPTQAALRIGEDLAQGLSYLPERDAALLVHWLDKPYSV